MSTWNPERLPRAANKTFVVTGGAAGIGYFITEQLASTGAEVIIAARSEERATRALETLSIRNPAAKLGFIRLDLADARSIESAAEEISALRRVDALVLNAGLKPQDVHQKTPAGDELVFGTNQLGNFALIARALPALERTPGSRIVTMGSLGYTLAKLDPADVNHEGQPYRSLPFYTASKFAQMLTAFELDRRLRAAGSGVTSVTAHPGVAMDELAPDRRPALPYVPWPAYRAVPARLFSQGKDAGAWPAVRATLQEDLEGGTLWGPRFLSSRGAPVRERLPRKLRNAELAARIWELSVNRTGLEPLPAA
ncbi:SDR family NAD(P)-dependent oxidoreductase [Mycetocola tolaasinivorans]|uniref:SDR family NAD(P)-dependent oxidoreductase n=1 Tax=Mycetocola tolaasinivorans TaxID=76635 RepID=A0A3L7A4P3_9MICO|nr:SDR family NAD(P)-dependent oxidoreductase [Mycetocola tolaasinivorans]RLP74262.1 SDR family NAD(P)-dependent oxidoreductase [Mycetocola tolaasinivorans]